MTFSAKDRLQLSVTQLRWLQEMGLPPALLRSYASPTTTPQAPSHAAEASGAGRALFLQQLQQKTTEAPKKPLATQSAVRPESPSESPLPSEAPPKETQALPSTDYEAWEQQLMECTACQRSEQRLRVLPGYGQKKRPTWFVLGGLPNRQDERMGKAWQSSAGRLLEAQLRSLGLDPQQDTYCSYALKCRADEPQPSPESIQACRQRLLTELQVVAPKHLLLLGPVAVQMVFGAKAQWQQLRGQVQRWQLPDGPEFNVVVSQDPAALLLRPQQKAQAWRDLLLVKQLMAAE